MVHGQSITVPLCYSFLLTLLPCSSMDATWPSLQEVSTSSGVGSSVVCSVDVCSSILLSTGCRGLSAPAPKAPPPFPYSPILVSAGFFLTLFFITAHCLCGTLLFHEHVFPETPAASLTGSAVSCGGIQQSWLEQTGTSTVKLLSSSYRDICKHIPPVPLAQLCCVQPVQGPFDTVVFCTAKHSFYSKIKKWAYCSLA